MATVSLRTVSLVLLVMSGGQVAAAMSDEFRTAAEDRIEAHRRQDAVLHLRDGDGEPLVGAPVHVRLREHAFTFGTQVNAAVWEEVGDEHPYRRAILAGDFNTAVLGNGLKWTAWERLRRRERSDRAIRWFAEHGLRVRGHTMTWGTDNWGVAGPKDIRRHVATREDGKGYTWTGEPRPEWLRQRIEGHVEGLGRFFRDRIHDWDVVNEPVSEHWFVSLLEPDGDPQRSDLLVDWFRAARRGAGPSARLAINEFHILVGDHPAHQDGYAEAIEHLIAAEAPVGAIGFQGHFYHAKLRRTPAQLWAVLERFGAYGLPMFVSEFDCSGKGWGKDQEVIESAQAEFLEEILLTCFSHPLMDGFVIWGYWDGSHWLGNAPFYRQDWSEKPSLAVWRRLVRDQWWTDIRGTTDAQGRFAFRGFKGRYEVIVVDQGDEDEVRVGPVLLGDEPLEAHLSTR